MLSYSCLFLSKVKKGKITQQNEALFLTGQDSNTFDFTFDLSILGNIWPCADSVPIP